MMSPEKRVEAIKSSIRKLGYNQKALSEISSLVTSKVCEAIARALWIKGLTEQVSGINLFSSLKGEYSKK